MTIAYSRVLKHGLLALTVSLLIACSKENVNKPVKLEKLNDKVKIERLWKRSVGSGDDELMLQLSPVIKENYIYTIDVEGALKALDRSTGKEVWKRELNERISGGLGVDDLRLYYTTFQGEMICLDRQNGNEVWRRSLSSEAISAPSSNGRLVVVQTIDGKLFSFETTEGIKRWRYDSVGPILSLRGTPSPVVSQKYTITTFANGEMLAFDNENGNPFWKAVIGLPQGRTELERLVDADGQTVIDGERIYAVAYQGKLVALNAATGAEVWSNPVSSYNGVAHGFSQVYVADADSVVLAFNDQDSNEIWRNEKLKYRRLSTPTVFGDMLVVADFKGYLHFLSLINGEFLARKRPDSDGVMGHMLVSGEILYVYTRSGDLIAYRIAD